MVLLLFDTPMITGLLCLRFRFIYVFVMCFSVLLLRSSGCMEPWLFVAALSVSVLESRFCLFMFNATLLFIRHAQRKETSAQYLCIVMPL
jgi:hypothetical protein